MSTINTKRPADRRTEGSLHGVVGRHIVHNARTREWKGGKWPWVVEKRDVILMAIAGNYAMVRRPNAMPYVAKISELEVPPNGESSDRESGTRSAKGVTD